MVNEARHRKHDASGSAAPPAAGAAAAAKRGSRSGGARKGGRGRGKIATDSGVWFTLFIACVAVLSLGIATWIGLQFYHGTSPFPSVVTPHPAAQVKNLSQFEERRDAMLWGSYRPHTYLGFRARVPQSVVAGLSWAGLRGPLRHICDHGDGLRYTWTKHDGQTFGMQQIEDGQVVLKTSFVKNVFAGDLGDYGGDWATRITVSWKDGTPASTRTNHIPIFFYFYNEGPERFEFEEDGRVLTGTNANLGNFRARFFTNVTEDDTYTYTGLPVDGIEKLTQNLTTVLLSPEFKWNRVFDNAQAYLVQVRAQPPFELTVVYESLSPGDGAYDLTHRHGTLHGSGYDTLLAEREVAFDAKFDRLFALKQKGFSEEQISFAKAALSNMLGSVGYWYGASIVRDVEEDKRRAEEAAAKQRQSGKPARPLQPALYKYFDAPLYSGVPSRSFFPRGFMWDEGFHQLLINRWDPGITRDVLAHWLDLMNVYGWIPREQILGREARSKVPDEFVVQPSDNANPPTWFLVMEDILDRIDEAHDDTDASVARDLEFIRGAYPRFAAWFKWFDTQRGALPGTYRWRGRQRKPGMMNPLTLTSGLDDYPRASHPDENERHLDLRCWMAEAAAVLARIAQRIGEPAHDFEALAQQLRDNAQLNSLHWSNRTKAYHDYGRHRIEAHNTEHDPPYWRGAIWINLNFLTTRALRFYGQTAGPHRERAQELYTKLRGNLINNIFQQYQRTGFIWEQYDDRTGSGKGTHPFTGWSALVVLLMGELY
ncbi:alpha-glucosidase 1 [Salpingoeca rosetta]|uniref:Mannosyl-oligosaccharide glucosidase n=1 Tax=Salpingoeca rosetta (strain ATCC 50818 / BSB-021) TaxID=946362 RepID=F2U078_SALR5|nr:alpha-glucosidase 1 [Salpingoeca rosetta]EGD80806.1 alpha-glucosidase 1 [Salpingoeca rosetta]|eukprot:XP_004997367.1 alpha-glucosidase 1 [Salpingoeca rosetta]